jgi:CheY-like chemotaxis protein
MTIPAVLVADDDAVSMCILHHCLSAAGFNVLRATDGREMLRIMAEEHPDLVISDVMMPVMDGIEALRRAKSDPALRDIPIIMVTSREHDTDIVAALTLGAADYLVKPFIPNELSARVARLLAERQKAA